MPLDKKLVLLLWSCLIASSFSFSQGTVRGKISDENGEPAIGAAIMRKSNMTFGGVADLYGSYSIKIDSFPADTLIISWIGYRKLQVPVFLQNGEVVIKNVVMLPAADSLKEVEITAKAVKAKDYYMEQMKMKSVTTVDYISAETIKKTGDPNVTAAVARVSGVSTNGGFVTVRGIGDRYVKTTINGLRIPTLDPFTNNIKLDLFPSSLIDNIIITKTASPDLPGDWAGAYLSIETKDYPEKLAVNVESTVGYNNQTSFKDVVSSQHSSTDWLGYDNGFRDHSHTDFVTAIPSPTPYQEFVGLGLGSYFNSLGYTENWAADHPTDPTFYKLGLVQLGLLAPALINDKDESAFNLAKAKFEDKSGTYYIQAFNTLNAGAAKSGQSFPNNWNTLLRKAPLNFSQSFSIGNQTKLFGKELGFIVGFRYGTSIQYDPNSTTNRVEVAHNPNVITDESNFKSRINQQATKETNGWSALMNLAYKLNSNHSVSLLFMPNLTGVNNVRNSVNTADTTEKVTTTKSQNYEERKQLVYQYKSEHYFPRPKLKAELNASYTNGKSSVPDFKNLGYERNSNQYLIGRGVGEGIHRYYRYLSDNLFDSKLSMELPIWDKPGLSRKLKWGGSYQRNDRKSDNYDYEVVTGSTDLKNENIDAFLNVNNFAIINNKLNYYYDERSSYVDHTFGKSSTTAGFIMTDYSIIPSLRFSGGFRVEHATIFTDVFRFDSLGFAANDPRRIYKNGYNGDRNEVLVNPGKVDATSYLPSTSVIYKLKNSDETPINLRGNYSKTVARPSIRELSDVSFYDYEFRTRVIGNSELKMVQINNYDLRLESYFKSGDNASISFFYKDFIHHIELVQANGINTWQNVDEAWAKGVELEGRKKLTKHFALSANATFVKSQSVVRNQLSLTTGVRFYGAIDGITRPMFGQAPYVLNGMLTYTADSLGLTATFSYNVQGSRLAIVSADRAQAPDIYEMPRQLLDFKVSKKLGKYFVVSLAVGDILNAPIVRSYIYKAYNPNNGDRSNVVYDKFTYGTNYRFSISYKI